MKGIGNCPVCGFACKTVGHGKVPRHGHVKNPWMGTPRWKPLVWLPRCRGSGLPAVNFQEIKPAKAAEEKPHAT